MTRLTSAISATVAVLCLLTSCATSASPSQQVTSGSLEPSSQFPHTQPLQLTASEAGNNLVFQVSGTLPEVSDDSLILQILDVQKPSEGRIEAKFAPWETGLRTSIAKPKDNRIFGFRVFQDHNGNGRFDLGEVSTFFPPKDIAGLVRGRELNLESAPAHSQSMDILSGLMTSEMVTFKQGINTFEAVLKLITPQDPGYQEFRKAQTNPAKFDTVFSLTTKTIPLVSDKGKVLLKGFDSSTGQVKMATEVGFHAAQTQRDVIIFYFEVSGTYLPEPTEILSVIFSTGESVDLMPGESFASAPASEITSGTVLVFPVFSGTTLGDASRFQRALPQPTPKSSRNPAPLSPPAGIKPTQDPRLVGVWSGPGEEDTSHSLLEGASTWFTWTDSQGRNHLIDNHPSYGDPRHALYEFADGVLWIRYDEGRSPDKKLVNVDWGER